MLFLIGALRAVIELVGLCLLGQGVLHLLAGAGAERNAVYRLFALLTAPPRRLVGAVLPAGVSARAISALTFVLLLVLWVGLAWVRTFI